MEEKKIYDPAKDDSYGNAYIDIDEMRERELYDGRKITYRHVHGGFEKRNVKFLFCFPEKEAFLGRFFQYLSPFPGPDEENASLDKTGEDDRIAFALLHGAYFVESNMGSVAMFGAKEDETLVWKASAAVAEYSRKKAMEIYGCSRPYGYVHGGSGGGYKTMACIENTRSWDGAVPYVIGSPVSLPNTVALHAQGQRTLRHVFGKIVDALDAGGSGDMYEGLNEDEQAMLKEVTEMGFPPRTWFLEAEGLITDGSLPVLLPGVKRKDPSYFEDFWKVPGYAGADPKSNALRDRLCFHGVVKKVHLPGASEEQMIEEKAAEGKNGVDDAWRKMLTDGRDAWIELEEVPKGEDLYLAGVTIKMMSGAAGGMEFTLGAMHGNCLVIGMCYGLTDLKEALERIAPGDQVFLDNSDYVAVQSYYRHQVPQDRNFHAWDQFRDKNGNPTLPQRKEVLGYEYCGTGTVQDGKIQGKVIVIQSLMDESTCPWCGDWYRETVKKAKGNEDDFRLYYMDRCMHGDVSWLENNVVTNYLGAMRQALLDVSDWVERGIEPCESTVYERNGGRILVKNDASCRRGLQPSVKLLANGKDCVCIKAGEEVRFTAEAWVPQGAGEITGVDYAFVSDATLSLEKVEVHAFPYPGTFAKTEKEGCFGAVSEIRHTYDMPGTYFASVRVTSQRDGKKEEFFTQVKNIARVRVIVEE